MRSLMIKYITVFSLLLLLSACQQQADNKKEAVAPAAKDKMYVAVKTFQTSNGWGYSIYADGKLYIQQAFIPGITGTHGFSSQTDAQKTGDLVLNKMKHQQRFPVVTRQELQALGVSLP
jgi:hypothetical protein